MLRSRTFAGSLSRRFVALAVISTVGVGVGVLALGVNERTRLMIERNGLAASSTAHEMDSHLAALERQVLQVRAIDARQPHGSVADVQPMLAAIVEGDPTLESSTWLDDDGVVVAAAVGSWVGADRSAMVGADRSRTELFVMLSDEDAPVWCDVCISPLTGRPIVSYATPITSGYVVVDVAVEALAVHMLDLARDAEFTPVVVDGNGVVLAHPDPAVAAERRNWSDLEPVAQARQGHTGDFDFASDGKRFFGSTAIVPKTGWTIVMMQPVAQAWRSVRNAAILIALVVVVAAVAATLIALAQAHSLGAPLSDLSAYAGRVGRGDYDEPPGEYRHRELSELAGSLAAMGDAVRDRERQVVESEHQYRYFVETLHAIPWEYDLATDRFTFVGPQTLEMLGRPVEEWTDLDSWAAMIHPEDAERAVAFCQIETTAGRAHAFDYRMLHADGHSVWIRDVVAIRTDAAGGVTLSGVLVDVSAEKDGESDRLAAERARAASEAKSDFLSRVSHELRTPLNSIIGFSGVLLAGLAGDLNDEQRRQIEMIETAGRHQLAVVTQVLDLRRIEAGREQVAARAFDFGETVREVVSLLEPMADEMGIDLSVDLPATDLTVKSDAQKLRQILLNLVSNAVRATAEGSVTVRVLAEGRDVVIAEVRDTGPGMSPEELARAFVAFGLSRRADDRGEGTGLGLTISQRLAGLLGGEIRAESTPGEGSVFTLRFAREL